MTGLLSGTSLLAPVQSRPTETDRKIETFRHLPIGWHYGSGGPISEDVIQTVQNLYKFVLQIGLTKTDVFAGADGEILMTAYHERHYVAIIAEANGEISVSHENADTDLVSAEHLDIKEAKRQLLAIAEDIWSSSGSSTQGTTTRTSEGSMTWLLRIRPGVECQSSSAHVLSALAA